MASNSEKTFGQRYQSGRNLVTLIENLKNYHPSNEDISAKNFDTFLDGVDQANSVAAQKKASLTEAQNARSEGFYGTGGLRKTAPMIRDFIASTAGGRTSTAFRNVQRECQKMTNYTKPKKIKDDGTATAAEKKASSKAETSFGSLLQNAKNILEVIKTIPGYAPSNPSLTVEGFGQFIANLEQLNETVARLKHEFDVAVERRAELYEGANGLRVRIRMTKDYIGANYGKSSNEYKEAGKVKY